MKRRLSLIAVGLSIAASLLLSAWRITSIVPEASLDAAAVVVRERFHDGDLIIVEPWPQVGPRLRLGDLPLLEPKALHRDDLVGFRRALLLELDTIGASGRSHDLLTEIATGEAVDAWPDLRLTTFVLRAPVRVLFDLHREIDRVRVTARYPGGEAEPCDRFRRDRWSCPRNPDWSYVGREIRDIGNEPRTCVWLHPLHRGGELTVELPPELVVHTPGAFVLGGYGFTDHAARAAQAPVELRIEAGAETLLDVAHPVSTGWQRYRAALPPDHGPLRISVRSENNGVAHFCFALRVMEPMP